MVRIRLGFKIFEVQFFFLILKEASFINTILSPNSQSSLSQKTALPYQKCGHGPQFCTLITSSSVSVDYLQLMAGVFTPPSMSTTVTRTAEIASNHASFRQQPAVNCKSNARLLPKNPLVISL